MQARCFHFPTKWSESLLTKWDAAQTCPEDAAGAVGPIPQGKKEKKPHNNHKRLAPRLPSKTVPGWGRGPENGQSFLKVISYNLQGEGYLNFSPNPPKTQRHRATATERVHQLRPEWESPVQQVELQTDASTITTHSHTIQKARTQDTQISTSHAWLQNTTELEERKKISQLAITEKRVQSLSHKLTYPETWMGTTLIPPSLPAQVTL